MFKLIKAIKSIQAAQHRKKPFPASRLLVTDVVHEGRRKNTVHEIFEADITDFMAWRSKTVENGDKAYSVTAFVSSCLAQAVGEQLEMQAYRSNFGKNLVIFDDVDIVFTVEKTVQGNAFPWTHTIRACNQKTTAELDAILKRVKTEQVEGTQRWRIASWLMKQPRIIRRLIWILPRYSPFFMKHFIGTVGVTSLGMFTNGNLAVVPITPMTLTLSIGSIDPKLVYQDGNLAQRETITLTLSADHDVIDGATLARFISVLREKIAAPDAFLG